MYTAYCGTLLDYSYAYDISTEAGPHGTLLGAQPGLRCPRKCPHVCVKGPLDTFPHSGHGVHIARIAAVGVFPGGRGSTHSLVKQNGNIEVVNGFMGQVSYRGLSSRSTAAVDWCKGPRHFLAMGLRKDGPGGMVRLTQMITHVPSFIITEHRHIYSPAARPRGHATLFRDWQMREKFFPHTVGFSSISLASALTSFVQLN